MTDNINKYLIYILHQTNKVADCISEIYFLILPSNVLKLLNFLKSNTARKAIIYLRHYQCQAYIDFETL